VFPPKKIVFPVDFSERCEWVAPMALAFARRFESELTLLHVSPLEGDKAPVPPARVALETFAARSLPGLDTKLALLQGDPAREIVRFSEEHHADLLMMPTRGRGAFRRFLFGSVTAKILHDAAQPVWTDIHAREIPTPRNTSFHNVVCALDLTKKNQAALRWAAQFSAAAGARLLLVHVVPLVVYASKEVAYWTWQREIIAAAREHIESLLLREGIQAALDVVTGDIPYAVRDAARNAQADLLVIARSLDNGQPGRLRSHAYPIIQHSPCPVVSV
jgi:nucleotide-binding universal stress UspA family protein